MPLLVASRHRSHIRAKTMHLEEMGNTFFAMLVFDPKPSTRTYGTREFETVANARMVELKWEVRRLFNTRDPSTGEMTHNHVVHVTDDTPEVDPVLRCEPPCTGTESCDHSAARAVCSQIFGNASYRRILD